jgi:glycosyltransferase involved in cell wall biosynthesis
VIDFIEENSQILASGAGPLVAILMGTMNGVRFLPEQLDSLAVQTHQNWVLIASDDGSTDDTINILKAYQAKWPPGKLIIKEGPKQGFCVNFLSMACDPQIHADYYAFCDQDDVWLPSKLSVGVSILGAHTDLLPRVYCGRTIYINEQGCKIGESPKYIHPKHFRNALVQCVAGGNTMVFNRATKELLEKIKLVILPSHDWWLYQIVTGVGGHIHFDQNPLVLYRQHPDSLVGENKSLVSKLERISMVFQDRFAKLICENLSALESCCALLSDENQEVLKLFIKMRAKKIKDRFRLMGVCGIYRQSWQGTLTLFVAALFKKI